MERTMFEPSQKYFILTYELLLLKVERITIDNNGDYGYICCDKFGRFSEIHEKNIIFTNEVDSSFVDYDKLAKEKVRLGIGNLLFLIDRDSLDLSDDKAKNALYLESLISQKSSEIMSDFLYASFLTEELCKWKIGLKTEEYVSFHTREDMKKAIEDIIKERGN